MRVASSTSVTFTSPITPTSLRTSWKTRIKPVMSLNARTALVVSISSTKDRTALRASLREWLHAWVFKASRDAFNPMSFNATTTSLYFYNTYEAHTTASLSIRVTACILPLRSRIIAYARTPRLLPGERRLLRDLHDYLCSLGDVAILYKPRHVRLRAQKSTSTLLVAQVRCSSPTEAINAVRDWAQRMQYSAIAPIRSPSAVQFRKNSVHINLSNATGPPYAALNISVRSRVSPTTRTKCFILAQSTRPTSVRSLALR